MLGKKYINDKVPEGMIVNCVYIQEKLNIDKQLYIHITLDEKE